jgi:site-specific DNA recombinase
MRKAIGYVRVSTEQQAAEGVSLAAQTEKIRTYCVCYDIELVDVIVDAGASASSLERDGLQRALAALESGAADTLVVVKLDRLTRSVRDLDALLTRYFATRYALVSVGEQVDTTTATGRMVLNVLMSVSQWEREIIGERTRAALAHKKAQGEFCGGHAPYGYRVGDDGVTLVEDDDEQGVIDAIVTFRQAGMSLRAIVAKLDEAGHIGRTGRPLKLTAVARIVGAA